LLVLVFIRWRFGALQVFCTGEKQSKVRDSELPGFFVLIGKRRKTFMAHGEFWRDGVREFTAQVKLGNFGEMTTRQARGKAKEALGQAD
jgi:hypothetical protein